MSKCTFEYNGKKYSREGLLAKLASDLKQEAPIKTKESIQFLKSKLGMSDEEIVIINGIIGAKSLGRFKTDGKILLSSFADDNVGYHEAFHRVYRMHVNAKDRALIQDQFRKRKNWESKIDGYRSRYPSLNDDELIEEYLADEFADYVLNNGNIKIEPIIRSTFDKILDFIKKILGISNKTIYDIYKDISEGNLKNKVSPDQMLLTTSRDKVIINDSHYSAEVKNEFIQAVSREFLNEIFDSGTIYDLINGTINFDTNTLYRQSINRILNVLEDDYPDFVRDVRMDMEKGVDSYINNQFAQYIQVLGGKFEITYIEQAQDDALLEEGEVDNPTGRQHDDTNLQWVASFQIDPKTSISKSIKLLLATLENFENTNTLQLPSQVRWSNAFNKIAQHLAGVPTSDAIEHLSKLSEPWVDSLIERLGGVSPSYETLTHEQFRLRNEFIKTFAKTANTYAILSVEDSNIKWFNANQNTKDKKRLQEWNNSMVKAINDAGGFDAWYKRVLDEIVNSKNPTEDSVVELLGIDVHDDLKNDVIIGGDTFMSVMNKVANIIKKRVESLKLNNENLPNFNNLFSEKVFDIKGTLEKLSTIQSEYDNVVDLMVTSRGKRLYGISLNTHTTTTINTLNYISSLIDPQMSMDEKLEIVNKYLPDVLNYQTIEKTNKGYNIKSKWLSEILNGNKINVIIVDGVKTQHGDESAIADLNESDLLAATLNLSVSGVNISVKHSDRSVYYAYHLDKNSIFDYQEIGAATTEDIINYLTLVMQDQLATEKRRANLQNVPMIQYFAKNYKNSSIFDLKNIENLDPYSADIEKMIKSTLVKELENYNREIEKWKVKDHGISDEYLKRYNNNVDFLIANSFANQLLTHLEEMRVLLSDFTFFKDADDFYKRMATTSGTGELLVNDDVTNEYIAQMNDFEFEIVDPRTGKEYTMKYAKPIDGSFSSLALFEKKDYESPISSENTHISPVDGREVSQAVYLFEKNMILDGVNPEIAKKLSEEYAQNYNKVNENDGQSWMNMFFFREYMMRLGQWSREMENLFLAEIKILKAKDINELKNITIEIDGKEISVFDWNNWKEGMFESVHTLKSQYAGFSQSYIEYRDSLNGEVKDFNEKIRPYTIYKTSYHVLWPSTIFGTNLAQLHFFMLTHKIDTVPMMSANKSGGIDVQEVFKQRYNELNDDQKKVADHGFNFYDQYGHFNDFVFQDSLGRELLDHSLTIANINSLKDQVKIGNHEKSEIRGSTQSLKILLSNLMQNGTPRFDGADDLIRRYKEVVSKLVIDNVNKLREELTLNEDGIERFDKFVDVIKKAAEERFSPVNIIESIEGFMADPFIETLPNKTKMENIFYSIVTNNAIVFNRPGNSYPQVAPTGFEAIGDRTITDPSKMKILTQSDLKFYSIETDKDGNITKVNPAEIMMPIPKEWIPTILKKYKTSNIVEAINYLNDDIERGKVDTDITFKGVRIPNQQLSSNDIVKVKKFLLPTNSNFVVVPSELVVKTGSDFDIDKLNIYWGGTSSLFNKNKSESFNELLEIEKEILLHPRNAHLLFMPVIDDLLKNNARKEIIGNLKKQPLKDTTTFLQALTPHKNVEKGIIFVKSKFGVGVVALDITGHALFTVDNVNIRQSYNNPNNDNKPTSTKLLFEGMQSNFSLTNMYDASQRIISEVQSQTMNSQVDAGKDPYAVGLGINNQTLNIFLYLNRRGVPAITALKFINQPMIQQYLELQRINESFINKQRGDELSKQELIDFLYTLNNLVRPSLNRYASIRERDLNNGITNGKIDAEQAQFFEYFLALVDEVSAFNDIKNSMTVDTKGQKDRASLDRFLELQDKVATTELISLEDLHKIRTTGLLAPFYRAQQLYHELFFPFYAVDSSAFGEYIYEFKKMLESRQRGNYMKDKVRTTIENDFIVFLIQNFHEDFSLESFNKIFGLSDDESIAKQIKELQDNPLFDTNPVLKALYPLLSVAKDKNQNKFFDVLRLFERELTTIDTNDFIDAMADIRDDISEDLYKSIIQLGVYQAGFLNSPFSLNKILPTFKSTVRENGQLVDFENDYLREIQTTIINDISTLSTRANEIFPMFVNLFYMNNPQFLPKRYWKKSPIPFFYLWNKEKGERVLKYINGNTVLELEPLGNTYFKRYFAELMPIINLTPETKDEGQKSQPQQLDLFADESFPSAQDEKNFQELYGPLEGSKLNEEFEGKLEANKDRLIELLGSSMYSENLKDVVYKELLQNSFDAIKIAQSKGLIGKGNVDIVINEKERTISFTDNGIGMTPEIVQKAFFTIGGTYKGDNIDNRLKSGGLGLAKMAFIFGSEKLSLETVHNGVQTSVSATSEEIRKDNFKIKTETTNKKNGTTVTVKIPESYVNTKGETRTMDFPRALDSELKYSFLKNPLIGNIDVNYSIINRTSSYQKDESVKTNLGKLPEGYILFTPANTDFADMDIYINTIPKNNKHSPTYHSILSSGLFQFSKRFSTFSGDTIPLDIIIDIKPTVDTTNNQYPFNNQRENFRPSIKEDLDALNAYLASLWRNIEVEIMKQSFNKIKNIEKIDVNNINKEAIESNRKINESFKSMSNSEIIKKKIEDFKNKNKNVIIKDGGLKTNEISLSKEDIEKERERRFTSSFRAQKEISTQKIDTNLNPNKPIVHNNTNMDLGEATLFLSEISSIMLDYKKSIIDFYGKEYSKNIEDQLWGVSIDKTYGGVNVNPAYLNMLAINPFYSFPTNPNVDAVNYIAVGLDHLIIHELNHNFVRDEGAQFTGRFLTTYSEVHSLPNHFELISKLKQSIKNNLELIKKLNHEYKFAENVESGFEGNKIETDNKERANSRTESLFESNPRYDERSNKYGTGRGDSFGEIIKSHFKQDSSDLNFNSIEDQIFMPDELKEAEEKKNECRGSINSGEVKPKTISSGITKKSNK